jgi:hypothetical protein
MSARGRGLAALRAVLIAGLIAVAGGLPAAQAQPQKKPVPAGATEPAQILDGIGGIEWGWTPRNTVATLMNTMGGPQPTVVWVGRIIDVRAGKPLVGDGDSVVEFLAAYMPLAQPGPQALGVPVRLRPETGEHFVVSLRSPAVSEEMLNNLRQSMLDVTHYTVVVGEPRFVAPFGRWSAIFLQTRRATVTQQLKIEIVRD